MIADRLAAFVNEVYDNPLQFEGLSLVMATVYFSGPTPFRTLFISLPTSLPAGPRFLTWPDWGKPCTSGCSKGNWPWQRFRSFLCSWFTCCAKSRPLNSGFQSRRLCCAGASMWVCLCGSWFLNLGTGRNTTLDKIAKFKYFS